MGTPWATHLTQLLSFGVEALWPCFVAFEACRLFHQGKGFGQFKGHMTSGQITFFH